MCHLPMLQSKSRPGATSCRAAGCRGGVLALLAYALTPLRCLTRCAVEQVVVMRLPVDQLEPFIPQILEGVLLWCEDSKNKFRLKVSWGPALLLA